jgi:ATP-dependent Clp protease protease subunit
MLRLILDAMAVDDARTEAIVREHVQLTAEQSQQMDNNMDLSISAADSVAIGLATEIGDFSPPAGAQIFNIS